MADTQIQQNFIPNTPTLRDLLDLFKKEILLNFNSHHIGTVQNFNATNQTATVTINYKKTYFKRDAVSGVYKPVLLDYPILLDCPVIALGGGTCTLTFPITAGDECLVLFNDRDLDNWFRGGSGSAVATARLHSFSDGIILVGLRSLAHVLTGYDTTRAVLKNGTTFVGVGPSLIKIANNSTTLNTLLQSLITNIQSLITQLEVLTVTGVTAGSGVSGVPANAAAFVTIGTQLSTTASEIAGLLE